VYNIYQNVQNEEWKRKNATTRGIDSDAKCQEGMDEACKKWQCGISLIKKYYQRKKPLIDFGQF
jgi:hypothetical protein